MVFRISLKHPSIIVWVILLVTAGIVIVSSFYFPGSNLPIATVGDATGGSVRSVGGYPRDPPASFCDNALKARFNFPSGLAFFDEYVWIADTGNHSIRNYNGGIVTTRAGGSGPGLVNGPSLSAKFNQPRAIAASPVSGDIYVADSGNSVIRKIAYGTGIVSTFAGGNSGGGTPCIGANNSNCKNGQGTQAQFSNPWGITVKPNGDIVVADRDNFRLRMITPNGMVSTIAGTGGEGNPPIIPSEANGSPIGRVSSVVSDPNGVLYFSTNRLIGKLSGGLVSSFTGYGNGSDTADGPPGVAGFTAPQQIAMINSTYLVVADAGNDRIRKLDSSGTVTTLVGGSTIIPGGESQGYLDGPGANCSPYSACGHVTAPRGVTIDPGSGRIFVADTLNHALRAINTDGVLVTLAGNPPGTCGNFSPPQSDCPFGKADCANGVMHVACIATASCGVVPGPGPAACSNDSTCAVCGDGYCSVGEVCFSDCAILQKNWFTYHTIPNDLNQTIVRASFCQGSCTSSTTLDLTDGYNSRVAVGPDLSPFFIFSKNGVSNDLYGIKCADSTCSSKSENVIPGTTNAQMYSLTTSNGSLPYLAFYEYVGSSVSLILTACQNDRCLATTSATIDIGSTAGGFNEFGYEIPSLKLGSDGLPVLIYRKNPSGIHFVKCASANCFNFSNTVIDPEYGAYAMSISPISGNPIIAKTTSAGLIRVIFCGNLDCTSGVLTVELAPSQVISVRDLTILPSGIPIITGARFSGQLVTVACSSSTCGGGFYENIVETPWVSWNASALSYDYPIIGYFQYIQYGTPNRFITASCLDGQCLTTQKTVVDTHIHPGSYLSGDN